MTWDGAPTVMLGRPDTQPAAAERHPRKHMWQRAWINGIDQYDLRWPEPFRLVQNEGRGVLSQGGQGWTDYEATSEITVHMAKAGGLAICVQGMRRYYAILLCSDQMARLVKMVDEEVVLAERAYEWSFGAIYKPLKKLVHKDFVAKTSSGPYAERGGRSKYMYALTPSGEEALKTIRRIYKHVWTEECELAFD